MIVKSKSGEHQDGMITAIGVLALLIGTATGDAILMLAISLVALAVMTLLFRGRLGQRNVWVVFLAIAIAAIFVGTLLVL